MALIVEWSSRAIEQNDDEQVKQHKRKDRVEKEEVHACFFSVTVIRYFNINFLIAYFDNLSFVYLALFRFNQNVSILPLFTLLIICPGFHETSPPLQGIAKTSTSCLSFALRLGLPTFYAFDHACEWVSRDLVGSRKRPANRKDVQVLSLLYYFYKDSAFFAFFKSFASNCSKLYAG